MKDIPMPGQPAASLCRDVEADFGARIRALRRSSGRSQEAVVSRMRLAGYDWHQTTLSKVEAGGRGVSLNEAYCLALILGAHLQDFLDQGPGELQRELDRASARFFESHEVLTLTTQRFQEAERHYNEMWEKVERSAADASTGEGANASPRTQRRQKDTD